MFEGLYGMYGNRISDVGGRRVLGMGGSLNAYIRTGNAYAGIGSAQNDAFIKKTKTKSTIDKFITFLSLAGITAGVIFGLKTKKLNKESIKDAFLKTKSLFSSFKIKKANKSKGGLFNKLKSRKANKSKGGLFSKLKSRKANKSKGGLFSKLFSKFKSKKQKNDGMGFMNTVREQASGTSDSFNKNINPSGIVPVKTDVDIIDKSGNVVAHTDTTIRYLHD